MNAFKPSRRRVLMSAAGVAALHAVPGVKVFRDARASGSGRTLVTIHLVGGCDALDTVIPYSNPRYAALRGTMAINPSVMLPLDSDNALHPNLRELKSLWDRNRVSIVHGVGYPNFNFSHFQARDIYFSGDELRRVSTGWLGRAMDAEAAVLPSPDPMATISISGGGGLALGGTTTAALQISADPAALTFPFRKGSLTEPALAALMTQPTTGRNALLDGVIRSMQVASVAQTQVRAAGALTTPVAYPAGSRFASALRHSVQLLRQDGDIRVIGLAQGNYDTHEDHPTRHATQLAELDSALGAFFRDIDAHGLANRVTVMLWSEFSRRVIPNASVGVDHGTAQAMVLIGAGVRRGIVGQAPRLAETDFYGGRYLEFQHDFRSVYATLLEGWLGASASTLASTTFSRLPLLL
jgi:uncharacterized protein (DUF1501 family)